MITLEIHVTHPDVVRGDARTSLYNSVAQTLEALRPEWNHVTTMMENGNLLIQFKRLPDPIEFEEESVIMGVV